MMQPRAHGVTVLLCVEAHRAPLQVVGRAHKGLDILQKLNEAAVDPDDLPLQPITITACGLSDSEACSLTPHH